jgi:hypothetical protein
MNDLALFLPLPVDDRAFLNLKAAQIRAVAANAVIEIGRHLIEAKERVGHGHFLPWVEAEFRWGERSAQNYMQAAEQFGNTQELADLNFTREALYLMAGPTVPEPARAAAIAEAEDGKRITKKRAEELIAEARQTALAEAVTRYRSDLDAQVNEAVRVATDALHQDREALEARIAQIHADAANLPGIGTALCHMLKQDKLKPEQCQNLAQIIGTSISVNGRSYAPISREQQLQVEEHLQIASAVTRAFETLAGAPPAHSFFDATWPVQRSQHQRVCRSILTWLSEYADLLDGDDN